MSVRILNLAYIDQNDDAMLFEDAAIYGCCNSWSKFLGYGGLHHFRANRTSARLHAVPALIVNIFYEDFMPILVLQCIIDAFTCLIIMSLGREVYPKHFLFLDFWQLFGRTSLFTVVLFFLIVCSPYFLRPPIILCQADQQKNYWQCRSFWPLDGCFCINQASYSVYGIFDTHFSTSYSHVIKNGTQKGFHSDINYFLHSHFPIITTINKKLSTLR